MKKVLKTILLSAFSAFVFIMNSTNVLAVTPNNGSLVFSPNPNDTYDDSGATYARMICLKHNGAMPVRNGD